MTAKIDKQALSNEINASLNWKIDWTKLKNDDLVFVHEHLTDIAKVVGSRMGALGQSLAEQAINRVRDRAYEVADGIMSGKRK